MKWPHNNWHERPQPDYWRGTSGSQVWIPARRSLCFIAIVLELIAAAQGESPLARPNRPQAEIRGAPGHRTVTYWQYAADASGHSQYSEPVIVTNAPDVLSEQAAIVVTPAPVEGATEYGLLSSRIEAPGAAKVEVGAPGDRTFYYWFQTRNGRTVWSPVTGPIRVDGCAAKPANKLTWLPTGAEFYYLYRTETPTQPMGWRGCVVLTALPAAHEMAWTDKAPDPDSRIIYPAGTGAQRPEGHGRYLVGRSNGAAIVDKGQELQSVAIYDLNTTDAANRQFKPEVRAYEPSGDQGAFQFDQNNRLVSPQYNWDHINSLALHQQNQAGGLNTYPGVPGIHRENAKNTYNGIDIHQFNYTPGQHSAYLGYMFSFGVGDNLLFHGVLDQVGQNRTAGDEGSEFFSLHMSRKLQVNHSQLTADAAPGDLYLRVADRLDPIAGGRGIINLSQAYREGQARIENCKAIGTGTHWTAEMEGWWISFDADTITSNGQPIRQWRLVERFISPTELQLLAYTYFGKYKMKTGAQQAGAYQLCPYTEMADGDAVTNDGLRVAPLQCAWKKGDAIEVMAGPQTTMRLGWWEMQGEFLPQDHIAGLGIIYGGKRPTDEGALICYNWSASLESHNADAGMVLHNTKAAIKLYKDSPVVAAVIRDDPYRFQLAHDANGFVIEDSAQRRWVSLGVNGITLHGKGTLRGNSHTRGTSRFSGDGQTTRFVIQYPDAYEAKPFVVASSNLPIGMGVTETTPAGCTVTFASPPAAGKDNIEITWMVQE